ncbi:MAG: hypothetical protein F6K26_12620 [Moorea sp. SIO2I5]|nr:hypothetical protein [Moorena sp. SIO2I5]
MPFAVTDFNPTVDLLQKYFSDSVLDAVAHGGDPQDRAASLCVNSCPLFPDPLFPVPDFCKKSSI